MTLQVQIVIVELSLLVLIATTVWNFYTLHRTVTTLWEIVKDLQQRRLH